MLFNSETSHNAVFNNNDVLALGSEDLWLRDPLKAKPIYSVAQRFQEKLSKSRRIAIYRKTLGLSHYQFAKKLGVAPCTIMNWEHDRVTNVEKKIRPYLDGLIEFD